MKEILLKLLIYMVFVLTTQNSLSQGTIIPKPAQNNELQRSEVGQAENIHCNPVLLNGKPLDYQSFSTQSTGELTLVSGDPDNSESVRIPFYVQLRRNGSIGQIADMNYLNKSVYSIEVSRILSNAKGGDLLIITPTRQQDWKAKRIIQIGDPNC